VSCLGIRHSIGMKRRHSLRHTALHHGNSAPLGLHHIDSAPERFCTVWTEIYTALHHKNSPPQKVLHYIDSVPEKFCTTWTQTRVTQNEVLLWKIAVLGMEKAPFWCWNILSLAHTGYLNPSMPERSSCLRSRTF
jgi:hypothetical protein